MIFHYNVTGRDRKALANAVSEILTQPAIYSGAPSFAYAIGGCLIDRRGSLIFPPGTSRDHAILITDALAERGFASADSDAAEPENRLTVEMPRADFSDVSIDNLKKIVAGKESLFKKVFGADSLAIEVDEHHLRFPWFTPGTGSEDFTAYAWFISALCKLAKILKRVNSKESEIVNEKFTMRLFLIRLGFVGVKYKAARKILLRNLTGNSSWKNKQ